MGIPSYTFVKSNPRRLGVRLPNWMGDVIMVTPTLRALRHAFPEAKMVLWGKPGMKDLVEGASWCDDYISEPPGESLDAILLLRRYFRSAWEAWRAGIPLRAGFSGDFRGGLLTHAVPSIAGHRSRHPYSWMTYQRRLMEGLGIPILDLQMELPLDSGCESRVEALLSEKGLDPEKPLVCLNPGAGFGPSKRWPEEYFARAGDSLADKLGGEVFILAGPGEEAEGESIQQSMSSRAVLFGPEEGNLVMMKSLIRRASVMLSNDSGPRHIGACFDIPTVVMVGPFHPNISENYHKRTSMMYEGVDCSPCHLRNCPVDHRCMTRITPEKVVKEALRLVEEKGEPVRSGV